MAQVEAVKTALARWAARHMYLNFADIQRPARLFWTEQAYQRLRRIKAAVDLGDLIPFQPPGLAGAVNTAAAGPGSPSPKPAPGR